MATTTRKKNRATFGSVRQLGSKRFQARYPDEAGMPMTAPHTFATSREAWDHIARVRADRVQGVYLDPRLGTRTLRDYAAQWIENGGSRGSLAPRTEELYRDLLDRFIDPRLGHVPLGKISPDMIRTWYGETGKELAASAPKKLKDGSAPKTSRTGETRQGQAYRLLHGILATAKADRLIAENPVHIEKAGKVSLTTRPLMTLRDFVEITDRLPAHHRTALYVALGGHLRLGELVGLRVKDWDAKTATITVDGQVIRTRTGLQRTQPKTASSHRTVIVPSVTAEILAHHLKGTPRALPDAPLLTRQDGHPITRSALQSSWKRARTAAKLEHFTLHDIRAAGLTLAAQSGATLPELMARAGHATSQAAVIYQRTVAERAAVVASNMDTMLRGAVEY